MLLIGLITFQTIWACHKVFCVILLTQKLRLLIFFWQIPCLITSSVSSLWGYTNSDGIFKMIQNRHHLFLLRPSVLEPMIWKDCPELSSQDSLSPPPEIVSNLYFPPEIFFNLNFPPEQRRKSVDHSTIQIFLTTKIVVFEIFQFAPKLNQCFWNDLILAKWHKICITYDANVCSTILVLIMCFAKNLTWTEKNQHNYNSTKGTFFCLCSWYFSIWILL